MLKIPVTTWIANAAACLRGPHGAVTVQAQSAGCSRQTAYDHAQKVHAAVEAEHAGGPTRQQLLDQAQALRHENTQLWEWLEQTIDFPEAKRRAFTVTAAAMGLSLNQNRRALGHRPGRRGPSQPLGCASDRPGGRASRRSRPEGPRRTVPRLGPGRMPG
jgi:hypothetical protein